jgi:hypothetical protein
MSPKRTYTPTFFDRHGPDGGLYLRAVGGSALVLGVSMAGLALFGLLSLVAAVVCLAMALLVGVVPIVLANSAGWTFKRVMVEGTSTPYVEQYSYQQALVMQGRVGDALASFESSIAEQPAAIQPRLLAAELYARDRRDPRRAATLFREVQRIESATPGDFILATNRLVDLYTGPLNEPGKALVELRRLIELHPSSPAAIHARAALSRLKSSSSTRE